MNFIENRVRTTATPLLFINVPFEFSAQERQRTDTVFCNNFF